MRHAPRFLILAAALLAGGCQQTTSVTPTPVISNDGKLPTDAERQPTAPVTAKAHFAAGQLVESQGDLDRAAIQYRAAIEMDPTLTGPMYRLGMILTAERKPDAPAVWQQYVTATGGTATAYSNLGFALDLAGRSDEAEAAFRAGIAKDGRCEACRVNYARLLARRGDLGAATAQLSAVLAPAEVQYDLGSIAEAQGDRSTAAARYHKALELDPTLSDAKARLASLN
jgi:tetratricopeptide (TPR) repeat protein